MIYVIGNSHVRYFLGRDTEADIEYVDNLCGHELRVKQCGKTGATIWGLDNQKSLTNAGATIIDTLANHTPDMAVISLGDVDLREHCWKHGLNIEELVDVYDSWVFKNVKAKHIVLVACPPFSQIFYDHRVGEDVRQASLQYSVTKFNRLLEEHCRQQKWDFLSFYEHLVEVDGTLRSDYIYSKHRKNDPLEVHIDYEIASRYARPALQEIARKKELI